METSTVSASTDSLLLSKSPSQVKPRTQWVDMAKGIAILLVVIGHFWDPTGPEASLLLSVIYSFHMPLFIALAGIFS